MGRIIFVSALAVLLCEEKYSLSPAKVSGVEYGGIACYSSND